jgi:hypothetical protein
MRLPRRGSSTVRRLDESGYAIRSILPDGARHTPMMSVTV